MFQRPQTAGNNVVKASNLMIVQSNEAPLSSEYLPVDEEDEHTN